MYPSRQLKPEQIDLARHMAGNGCTKDDLRREFSIGHNALMRILDENGIQLSPKPLDFKAPRPAMSFRRSTELEKAVERLRRTYKVVCCENTIRYPNQVPQPYTTLTKFRVGHMRNVPAWKVMEMAG